jgi:hypothetical protein
MTPRMCTVFQCRLPQHRSSADRSPVTRHHAHACPGGIHGRTTRPGLFVACGGPAVVHWQRRLTEAEIAQQQAIEQDRRREVALLADPAKPAPIFPPMPDFLDATTVVYACAQHGISLDAASLIHQSACAAPPVCTCKPEAQPDRSRARTGSGVAATPGW